jgi:hypothetical protein
MYRLYVRELYRQGVVMAFVSPDLLIEARLRAALNSVSRNPSYLDEMLSSFDQRGVEDVRNFFRNRKMPVLSGWPTTEQQVPCVTVQLRPEQEAAELQPINATSFRYQEDALVEMFSVFFRSVVQVTCYGNNQREATILALAVKWILLVLRQQLEEEGLLEQSLTISDYEPIPSVFDQSTPWFLRTVSLSVTHEDTWQVAQGPLIADIIAAPYDDRVE